MSSPTFFLGSMTKVKVLLGIENEDADKYDAVLQQIMTDTTYQFENELNRIIQYQTDRVQYFDIFPGLETFRLDCFPIDLAATFSVWMDYSRTFDASTLISATEYGVDADSGLVGFNWPRYMAYTSHGYKMMKVQYSGGMATDTADFESNYPDLSGAFTTEVAYRFQTRTTIGKIATTVSGASVTLPRGGLFLDLVQSVIDGHTRL